EGIAGERIGTHRTVIVAPKAFRLKRTVTLRELGAYPWVLYPEGGCICRDALRREFHARGLELDVAVSDFGLEQQLGLVAAGAGLGFVLENMVKASRYREKLRIVRVPDFTFDVNIWMIRPPFLGRLKAAVNLFGETVASRFGGSKTSVTKRR